MSLFCYAYAVISHEDEAESVAKGLHMGASDYLVEPLRKNELRNLWTHVWRQRHIGKLPPVVAERLVRIVFLF